MSSIQTRKSRGPNIEPCWTPDTTCNQSEQVPCSTTLTLISIRKIALKPVYQLPRYSESRQLIQQGTVRDFGECFSEVQISYVNLLAFGQGVNHFVVDLEKVYHNIIALSVILKVPSSTVFILGERMDACWFLHELHALTGLIFIPAGYPSCLMWVSRFSH